MTIDERVTQAVEGLRAESERLGGQSLDHGRADAGIAANVADTAADLITDLHAAMKEAERERDEARAENTRLRAALAQSDQPCAYCTLPAADWAKCQHGFPGCARADDAMGCPELGAGLRADALAADLERIKAIVGEQADNEALWFRAEMITEAILQQALRRLHAVVEKRSPDDCARAFLASGEETDG